LPHTPKVGCIASVPVLSALKHPEAMVTAHLVPML